MRLLIINRIIKSENQRAYSSGQYINILLIACRKQQINRFRLWAYFPKQTTKILKLRSLNKLSTIRTFEIFFLMNDVRHALSNKIEDMRSASPIPVTLRFQVWALERMKCTPVCSRLYRFLHVRKKSDVTRLSFLVGYC